MPTRAMTVVAGAVVAVAGVPARAGAGAGEPAADKSGYTLVNPTPRALMRGLSTDRPDTTESAFTVDAGHVQAELSFVDYSEDDAGRDGSARALAVAPMLLKVGLLNSVDLQLGLDPYTHVRDRDGAGGTATSEGFGDTMLRLKVNLWGNDAFEEPGDTALAVMPFVTFPTAEDGLGAGAVEGGVIVPLAVSLPGDASLGVMLELDFVRDDERRRYTLDVVHTVTLGMPLVGELSGYVEYAGFVNLSGLEDYRGFFDAGFTYAVSEDVQLDAGVRVGLTEAAEDLGLFAGVSWRW